MFDGGQGLPSMVMRPRWTSIMRRRARINDVLPLPEAPQTATFWPARMCRVRLVRMDLLGLDIVSVMVLLNNG